MYTKEEVYKSTLEYFEGDDLATNVWIDKYCLKDKDANYLELTPDDMHKRLAKEFARIELKYPNPLSYKEIYKLLEHFKYIIPAGSICYGAGNQYSISSLGNCFVIGNVYDSYGGICNIDQELCQLFKRRSGVGHDISHLRPYGSRTSNAAEWTTGPTTFMERYSYTARETAQSGRRGAQMITCNINHPDIEKFITSKDNLTKITGANISVKITDEFMKAVENDEGFTLFYMGNLPKDSVQSIVPTTCIKIKAKDLWDKLIHQAWKSAEPGVLFWDTITRESIPSCYGEEWKETSTNPCGEIPLCPYDSCRLLSVNLYSFVENPFTKDAHFNYTSFKDVVYKAQRLMDDIVDLEEEKIDVILNKIYHDPESEKIRQVEKDLWFKIKDKLVAGRRTGLSAIGLADAFAALGITYGSNDSISLAEEIYKQFSISAYKSSINMGWERGCFPIYNAIKEHDNSYLNRLFDRRISNPVPRRNIACLTIPPSGTISLLAGISSGIEPVYQLYYKRRVKITDSSNYDFVDATGDKWKEYIVLHPKFKEWIQQYYNSYSDKYFYKLGEEINWKDVNLEDLAKPSPYYKSTAYEIDPIQRVKLQATIQKWIDHSISSTINLAESVSESDVANIYLTAWKEGCKGITIYRNNCRAGVLVDADKDEFKQHNAPKRPKELDCDVHLVKANGHSTYVLVGKLYSRPYEIFATIAESNDKTLTGYNIAKGKISKVNSGKYKYTSTEPGFFVDTLDITEKLTDEQAAITRLVSTALRHGADIKFIVEQLNKTHGDLTSFSKALARALKVYLKEGEETKEICPDCKTNKLIYKDGCKTCTQCGYSRCG